MPSDEIYNLRREVLNVTNETLEIFVLAPSKDQNLADLIIGLKRFRNTVRWKWFFQEEKRKKKELTDSPPSQNALNRNFSFNDYDTNENENNNPDKEINEGLKSGLKPAQTTQNAPIGSPEVEGFLHQVEQKFIAQVHGENLSHKK